MTPTDVAAVTTTVVVGSGGAGAALLFIRRFARKMDQFFSDWNGEPARPGVPEKRGVMVRLDVIESEISYNHGSSIKDAVHRIDANVNTLMSNVLVE